MQLVLSGLILYNHSFLVTTIPGHRLEARSAPELPWVNSSHKAIECLLELDTVWGATNATVNNATYSILALVLSPVK